MSHFRERHPLTSIVLILTVLGCLITLSAPLSAEHVAPSTTPEMLAADWDALTQHIQESRYLAVAVDGCYRARNPEQQWQTVFDGTGFVVTPQTGAWSWGLALKRYGVTCAEQPVRGPARLDARKNRVDYGWDDVLTEWLVNDNRGLEHGFTLRYRPAGDGNTLSFTIQVQGDLRPMEHTDGLGVTFANMQGAAVLHYAGLNVVDAEGRVLPARMTANGDALQLVVDDRQAVYPITIDPLAQQAYLKASNTDAGDDFGWAAAISGDTVVVGAPDEDSNAGGVNGNQSDNSASDGGAAYVFVRSGKTWTQQAYLKASNTDAGDRFGYAVAIDGDTVVVGARYEDSAAAGVNGNQSDNSASNAGAAYVFVRSGTTWTQQAYLKASNPDADDLFGQTVAVSGDSVVVGARYEDSNAGGVNGNQADNSASNAGAAYVFVRSGSIWTQQAYLKASNPDADDRFGATAAIDGDTVVVGAAGEDSSATGVNGNQSDNLASGAGAAYVFVRSGTIWIQQAYLKASNTGANDGFSIAVAVDGDSVVVGARSEDSAATGINGNQADNSALSAGAAYVFVRSGPIWTQQAYLKASNTDASDYFGWAVAVSGDSLVVGAPGEDSAATGVNGNQADNSMLDAGATYVFVRRGSTWTQQAYLKASNPGVYDDFGRPVAMSGDSVVVGSPDEDSAATGVNGNQADNSASGAGATYMFQRLSFMLWKADATAQPPGFRYRDAEALHNGTEGRW